jgi:RimJ/RimL family protein N-acetyltransferase
MRAAVLDLAFDGLGADRAYSGAFVHNESSLGVTRSLGYRENGRRRDAPRGEPVEMVNFVISRDEWLAHRDPASPTTIEGLDACRHMFGA